MQLDQIEAAICRELASDARLPISELAHRINVSESTAHRRLNSLIARGVITGFSAHVDPAALGLGTEALIRIRLHPGARGALRDFYHYLLELEPVRHVYFVAGNQDFVAHVQLASAAGLRDFISDVVSARPEVASTNTSLVFDHRAG